MHAHPYDLHLLMRQGCMPSWLCVRVSAHERACVPVCVRAPLSTCPCACVHVYLCMCATPLVLPVCLCACAHPPLRSCLLHPSRLALHALPVAEECTDQRRTYSAHSHKLSNVHTTHTHTILHAHTCTRTCTRAYIQQNTRQKRTHAHTHFDARTCISQMQA